LGRETGGIPRLNSLFWMKWDFGILILTSPIPRARLNVRVLDEPKTSL